MKTFPNDSVEIEDCEYWNPQLTFYSSDQKDHANLAELVETSVETFSILRLETLILLVEARAGIEPAHTGFADQCITTLLPRHAL